MAAFFVWMTGGEILKNSEYKEKYILEGYFIKNFYGAPEVKELLDIVTMRTAYSRVQTMNQEVESKGYWTERGKVPVSFFHEKYPHIERGNF